MNSVECGRHGKYDAVIGPFDIHSPDARLTPADVEYMESHGHQSGTAAYCAGKLAEMEGAAKAMRTHYERELMDAQDYEGELLDAQEQYGVALAILARELKTARAQRDQQWTWLLFFVVLALLEAVAIVLHVAPAIDAWRRL